VTVTVMLVNSSCDASSAAKSPIAFVPSTPALAVDMTEESVLSTMYSTVTPPASSRRRRRATSATAPTRTAAAGSPAAAANAEV